MLARRGDPIGDIRPANQGRVDAAAGWLVLLFANVRLTTFSFPFLFFFFLCLQSVSTNELPSIYKRKDQDRVFCNRSVDLSNIKFFGFDMDYTLAVYKSPDIDILAYDLIVQRLVDIGYPEEMRTFKFDAAFPIRGLFYN